MTTEHQNNLHPTGLNLYDTAKQTVVPFQTREPGHVTMYVCGPTVYGPPHLGHGRFSLVFDVLRRYLEWSGHQVTYVSNITDIDDKIIARAQQENRNAGDITAEYEKVWYQTMDALGVKRPDHDPHATAYVTEMVTLIGELVANGDAYETSDGVYFTPVNVNDYGLLANQTLDTLQAGARIAVTDEKRGSSDFALWKKTKPGEPSWPSPWGEGRPGWHTECVVMSLDLLGDGFDLHGGGQDLAFPHHENERAQAVAAGHTFARHWMHNGFVEVDGAKMGKSANNYTNLDDLLTSTDPRAYRLLVLRSHYRSPIDVTKTTTDDATAALKRLDTFARITSETDLPDQEPDKATLDIFRAVMNDDLNTPAAIGLLFSTVTATNKALTDGELERAAALAAAARIITDAVGLQLHEGDQTLIPERIRELVTEREHARANKNWEQADRIRAQIEEAGYIIEDSADGPTVRTA